MPPILKTARLSLRQFEETDADAQNLVRLNANPNVLRYLGEGPVSLLEAFGIIRDRLVAQHRAYGVGRWAVELLDDGRFIGWAGFKYEPERGPYDLGYRFVEHAWGQGYGREASHACLAWADRELPGKRIVGRAHPENLGSVRILERLGGRLVGKELDGEAMELIFELREGDPSVA